MDADFYKDSPFRRPDWRAERVMELVAHPKGPLGVRLRDDTYVRTYRLFLLHFLAAGDDETKQQKVIAERPHAYHAHLLHYHPDREQRDILQARLLTGESLAETAQRFATDELAIDFYEKIFFDVRDRLHQFGWVKIAVLGSPEKMAGSTDGSITADQRTYFYKLFALSGGSLALDFLLHGIGPQATPKRPAEIQDWLDEAFGQIVRTRATMAAAVFRIDRHNVTKLLKLAVRDKRDRLRAKRRQKAKRSPEKEAEAILQAIEESRTPVPPVDAKSRDAQPEMGDGVPRAGEQPPPSCVERQQDQVEQELACYESPEPYTTVSQTEAEVELELVAS